MGTIVITSNISLDGVVQDPDGQEGFVRGGWFQAHGGPDLAAWAELETAEALEADAVLLGRASDEWFGSRWNGRDGEWAERLNALPKYVVSSTVEAACWTNGTVLRGDVVDEVKRLKSEVAGEIVVYASNQLVRTLIEQRLADELRLVVFPVVLGSGTRLFEDTAGPVGLRLRESRRLGENLTFVSYAIVG
ncbi:Dihydrofolate reductase [Nocardioides terrae]|uniref:Dihydrofolate reductase n=1 Tax=Nocardioides terrae TaxID=574651 RepID=A0A1I1NMW0_9ACTN|nr:dihydrofolate reductase family protein [Nocardioides terrae]SFC98622.1 Dihydrofolate reductase [Nocardioides terrae]